MNRRALCSMMWGWAGLLFLLPAVVHGQAPAPGAPANTPGPGLVAGDPGSVARQMSDRVRELGDLVASKMGKTPAGAVVLQDARELVTAIDEFRQALPGAPDGLRRRQLFSGVDSSWHHLYGQVGRAGALSPEVDAAAKRVSEVDAQLHKVLGLNAFPAVFYGDRASPGGMREIQRVARALVDRAETLLEVVRAELRGPVGTRLAEEVTSLVQSADVFHDGIDLDTRPDDLARNGFAGVAAASNTVAEDIAGNQAPDRVRAAWRSYRTTETLLRQALKLPVPQSDLASSAVPAAGRSTLLALAERLIAGADQFLVAFTPDARNVAEGGYFIADVRRLRGAAAEFRAEIPRAIEVGQLAYAFREVDALWDVLARRTIRIARDPTAANVQRIEGIGQTVTEIHQMLGMPGIPTVVRP